MGWYNGNKFKVKVNDMFDRMDGKSRNQEREAF